MSKQDVSDIANQDWSKFDFTRWNLQGLKLDNQQAPLAAWVRDVTVSPQAQQSFASGLGTIKSVALQDFQGQVKTIQERISTADNELTTRVTAAQKQITALQENMRAVNVPAAVAPDPGASQLSAKVLDQSTQLGLPGLQVRLFDTTCPEVTLAHATTDQNGNAALTLNRSQTESLTANKAEIAMEVLTFSGKSVFNGPAPCPKLNQTGTMLAPLTASADLAPHLDAAKAATEQQQAMIGVVTAKVGELQAHYQQVKADLQQQLQEMQGILTDLQKAT
jgi:hypothetical protein